MTIKQFFQTTLHGKFADVWLAVLRICIALFMLTHGIPKLQKLMEGGDIKFADPIGIGMAPSLALVVFAEVFCSVLLLLGLATRFICLVLIINMAVAVLVAHNGQPFAKMELALLYLISYITFLILGGGRYSVDHFIVNRLNSNKIINPRP